MPLLDFYGFSTEKSGNLQTNKVLLDMITTKGDIVRKISVIDYNVLINSVCNLLLFIVMKTQI